MKITRAGAEPERIACVQAYIGVRKMIHRVYQIQLNSLSPILSENPELRADYLEQCHLFYLNRLLTLRHHHDTPAINLTIRTCEAISIVSQLQKKFEEAEKYAEEVVMLRKQHAGTEQPDLLRSQCNLGVILLRRGRDVEAMKLLRHVYLSSRRIMGNNHPWTRRAMHNYAMAFARSGNQQRAQQMLHELSRRNSSGMSDKLQRLASLTCLAWTLKDESRDDACRDALARADRILQTDGHVADARRLIPERASLAA